MTYQGQKVAILGYGVEGKSAYRFFSGQGAAVTVFDEKLREAEINVQRSFPDDFAAYDIVVRTPSVRPDRIKDAKQVTSVTKLFFDRSPAPIIGVTGTKGKGTTVTLIAKILEASGKTAHVTGNIGQAALDILGKVTADDYVVFELSSFQLWDLKKSPHIAVVLMIEPDHQDIHTSMEEYIEAKSQITAHQAADDIVVYHPTNEYSRQVAKQSPGQKLRFMNGEGADVVDGMITIDAQAVCRVDETGLIGPHNLENICAALTATWQVVQDREAAARAIREFKGLEHRLEFVREVKGAKYFNDSLSSNPTAAIAAIKSFANPKLLILGGHDKEAEFDELAAAIKASRVRQILLVGATRHKIKASLERAGINNFELFEPYDMTAIVKRLAQLAEPGDVVLLSPACASFDAFKDYKDRGRQFKQAVHAMAEE